MQKFIKICSGIILAIMIFFFFTNDYGLVDLQKTSVVLGVGIDVEGDGYLVTAQVAVPSPSENGESVQYTEVSGRGKTVAEALGEINAKSGFYPKLLFCNLIILGENCKQKKLFEVLDYFYRNEYTQLTANVAMCKGRATDLFSLNTPVGSMNTLSFERIMSDEARKSGNVSAVNLKDVALMQYSESNCCYMPFIDFEPKASENGSAGGSQSGGGQSGGQSQGGGQAQDGSSSGTGASSSQEKAMEFTCNKTALFNDGEYKATIDRRQALMLNLLKGNVRRIITTTEHDGKTFAIGIKNNGSAIKLKIEKGAPVLTLYYKGRAQIQDATKQSNPYDSAVSDVLSPELLTDVNKSVFNDMNALVQTIRATNCDILGVKRLLKKFHFAHYDEYADNILQDVKVKIEPNVISVN